MTKTEYRLTKDRPVGGRKRKEGDVVALTAAEYASERIWGHLELVTVDVPAEAPATAADDAASADEPATRTRRTKG